MMIRVRVLIADDHPIVRTGLRDELASCPDIEVIAEAADGDEALQQTEALQPDVLLLDISMAGLDMTEVIGRVQTLPRPPRVLAFTAYGDREHVNTALQAGAAGYLLTTEPPEVIAAAIRAVAAGQTWLSNEVAQMLARQVVEQAQQPVPVPLTQRELEVLRLLTAGRTNQQLGAALNISERTVRFHLRSIFDKVAVNSRAEAIAWAIRHGLDAPSH